MEKMHAENEKKKAEEDQKKAAEMEVGIEIYNSATSHILINHRQCMQKMRRRRLKKTRRKPRRWRYGLY
jgi:hypothetical protein